MSTPSQATPELLVTNDGLAVATFAAPEGPYIRIVGFKVGSAYGYEPNATQTDLQGNILYSGQATSWDNIGNGILDIVMTLPPEAGPFQFGEVGLYLADSNGNFSDSSVLFAVAAFDELQTKFSSLGTNIVSSYTFHCLLKLQQSTAVFQIDSMCGDPISVDQYCWSDVYPPGVTANPNVQFYNMRELSPAGDASLLVNSSDAQWALNGGPYYIYKNPHTDNNTFAVQNASETWIQFAVTDMMPQDVTTNNRRFVIRTAEGFFRSVNNVTLNGSNLQFNLNTTNDGTYNNFPLPVIPAVGSGCYVFRDDMASMGKIYYEQIIDPPTVAPATNTTMGIIRPGNGTVIRNAGVLEAYGLLQSPSQGTGSYLTSADDLNSLSRNSGMYTYGNQGSPANVPAPGAAHVWHMVEDPIGAITNSAPVAATQLWYPASTGGGDSQGNNGYPIYWREYSAVTGWTNWFPFLISGKIGGTYASLPGIPFNMGDLYTYIIVGNAVTPGNTIQNPQVRYNGPVQPGTWRSHGEYSSGSDIFSLVFRIA